MHKHPNTADVTTPGCGPRPALLRVSQRGKRPRRGGGAGHGSASFGALLSPSARPAPLLCSTEQNARPRDFCDWGGPACPRTSPAFLLIFIRLLSLRVPTERFSLSSERSPWPGHAQSGRVNEPEKRSRFPILSILSFKFEPLPTPSPAHSQIPGCVETHAALSLAATCPVPGARPTSGPLIAGRLGQTGIGHVKAPRLRWSPSAVAKAPRSE